MSGPKRECNRVLGWPIPHGTERRRLSTDCPSADAQEEEALNICAGTHDSMACVSDREDSVVARQLRRLGAEVQRLAGVRCVKNNLGFRELEYMVHAPGYEIFGACC